MLETNEKYLSQEELDGILSKTFNYTPSQKELETKVLYDTYYISLIHDLIMTIRMASSGQKMNKKYGFEMPVRDKMSYIADVRGCINEINRIKGRPVKKNPNIRDLNMGDYNREIAFIQYLIKEVKESGGCIDFLKPFFEEFVELYKSLPKPILLQS